MEERCITPRPEHSGCNQLLSGDSGAQYVAVGSARGSSPKCGRSVHTTQVSFPRAILLRAQRRKGKIGTTVICFFNILHVLCTKSDRSPGLQLTPRALQPPSWCSHSTSRVVRQLAMLPSVCLSLPSFLLSPRTLSACVFGLH